MYSAVLLLHSWIRWIALVAGVGATMAALRPQGDKSDSRKPVPDSSAAERWGLVMMTALDVQMLLGLVLYLVLSPFTAQALQDFAAAMRAPQLRFWAVEHISTMVVAVILAHAGRVLARKAATPSAKRSRMLICYGLATVLMMLGTPWPGTMNGRPLFRL
jgi:hypothetical protein